MSCLTKLCVALLSTKDSTLIPLHYTTNDSKRGTFSSKTLVTLALAGVLHWVVVAITLVPGFKVLCWWHGIPSLGQVSQHVTLQHQHLTHATTWHHYQAYQTNLQRHYDQWWVAQHLVSRPSVVGLGGLLRLHKQNLESATLWTIKCTVASLAR